MELRKDYILDRYVIVSEGRSKRPQQFKKQEKTDDKFCYFCPGNEHTTPPEIGRLQNKTGKWKMRWFPNKFEAVSEKGSHEFETKGFFTKASAYGRHEVIVETNAHKKQLADLKPETIKQLLEIYAQRIKELSKFPEIKYVNVFKNHGREGGTSIVHSHTQIIAYNKVPELVKEEVRASNSYSSCPYCRIIKQEMHSKRKCFENRHFAAFAPYASRFHYEIWVFPKKHIRNITDMDSEQLASLAKMMKKILLKLKRLDAAYNFELHYAPKGKDLHFHIEITPRMAVWAGFEIATNEVINSVSPEQAAEFYRK